MPRITIVLLLMALVTPSLASAEESTCVPMDLSKLAGYYTAPDGSFVILEWKAASESLLRGSPKSP